MKSNQMEENLDMSNLTAIINEVFEIDILSKSTKRYVANGRKVFTKLMMRKGYSMSDIARFLEKDHTTIIFYRDDVDSLLKYTPNVLNKYLIVKDRFLKVQGKIMMSLTERELQSSIDSLNIEIERLLLENIRLREKPNNFQRLNKIMETLNLRTPIGEEDAMLRKINQMLNTKDE
jgi:hypothetical protein